MGKLDESFLSFFLYLFENDSLSLDVVTTALKVQYQEYIILVYFKCTIFLIIIFDYWVLIRKLNF